MRHILPFLREAIPRSFESWGRLEVAFALVSYSVIALAAFGALSPLGAHLSAKIGVALGTSAVVLFVILTLVITPAKMWGEAQEEVRRLKEQAVQTPQPALTIGGHAVIGSQFYGSEVAVGGETIFKPHNSSERSQESSEPGSIAG